MSIPTALPLPTVFRTGAGAVRRHDACCFAGRPPLLLDAHPQQLLPRLLHPFIYLQRLGGINILPTAYHWANFASLTKLYAAAMPFYKLAFSRGTTPHLLACVSQHHAPLNSVYQERRIVMHPGETPPSSKLGWYSVPLSPSPSGYYSGTLLYEPLEKTCPRTFLSVTPVHRSRPFLLHRPRAGEN